jgi:hypothetical protein
MERYSGLDENRFPIGAVSLLFHSTPNFDRFLFNLFILSTNPTISLFFVIILFVICSLYSSLIDSQYFFLQKKFSVFHFFCSKVNHLSLLWQCNWWRNNSDDLPVLRWLMQLGWKFHFSSGEKKYLIELNFYFYLEWLEKMGHKWLCSYSLCPAIVWVNWVAILGFTNRVSDLLLGLLVTPMTMVIFQDYGAWISSWKILAPRRISTWIVLNFDDEIARNRWLLFFGSGNFRNPFWRGNLTAKDMAFVLRVWKVFQLIRLFGTIHLFDSLLSL